MTSSHFRPAWAEKMSEDAAEAGVAAAKAKADEDDAGRRRHARGAKATNQARGKFPGSEEGLEAGVGDDGGGDGDGGSAGAGAGGGRRRRGRDRDEMDDQDREDEDEDEEEEEEEDGAGDGVGAGGDDGDGAGGAAAASAAGAAGAFVTIGLVGQPNVGKSTVLNSFMGRHVVQCSSTPGRTKHYQTHFMTSSLRLCDCPGLIFPAVVPRSLQVLAGG